MNRSIALRIALLAAIPLVAGIAACDRHPHDPSVDHSLGRVEIIDRGQTERPVVATWTPATGWTGALPNISMSTTNQRISLGANIFDASGAQRPLSEEGAYSVRWSLAPNATPGIVVNDDTRGERFHGDHIHIYGQAVGATTIQFVLWHVDHADGETDPVEIRVVQ